MTIQNHIYYGGDFCIWLVVCLFVGSCLSCLRQFDFIVETFVIKFVMVVFFPYIGLRQCIFGFKLFSVIVADSKWGFRYVYLNIYSFCFYNCIVRPIKRLNHLFDLFSTFCNYLCTILGCVGPVVRESTPFLFLESSTHFSIRIKIGKILRCNHFLI